MFNRTNLVYRYDGSFDGLLTCVFESYECHELPLDILSSENIQNTLCPAKTIDTDSEKARRVAASLPKKISQSAAELIYLSFLTCLPKKELLILTFIRKGFYYGGKIMYMRTDDTVDSLTKAVQHLTHEAHLFSGFVRFSVNGKVLTAAIEPKNNVLPLLSTHFCTRYPGEYFLIYDKSHRLAMIHEPHKVAMIIAADQIDFPKISDDEQYFRTLWKRFYDTIAIEGRYNPRCRLGHCPKRYQKNMTEFEMDKFQ